MRCRPEKRSEMDDQDKANYASVYVSTLEELSEENIPYLVNRVESVLQGARGFVLMGANEKVTEHLKENSMKYLLAINNELNRRNGIADAALEAVKFDCSALKTKESEALVVHDIYLPLNHLFNNAAKKAFSQKVTASPHVRKVKYSGNFVHENVIDPITYFGSVAVGERNIFDAAKEVANSINACAKEGWITGSLTKLALIKLASEVHEVERYIVVSYVAMTQFGFENVEIRKMDTQFKLGGLPESRIG